MIVDPPHAKIHRFTFSVAVSVSLDGGKNRLHTPPECLVSQFGSTLDVQDTPGNTWPRIDQHELQDPLNTLTLLTSVRLGAVLNDQRLVSLGAFDHLVNRHIPRDASLGFIFVMLEAVIRPVIGRATFGKKSSECFQRRNGLCSVLAYQCTAGQLVNISPRTPIPTRIGVAVPSAGIRQRRTTGI